MLMKIYYDLFISFFKIGILTFGGGMSMLPMLRREAVYKHGWAEEGELLDWFAIAQCTPGIIAVNVSAFIGRHVKGWKGGLTAAIGVVFPSLIVIVALAAFISNFSQLVWVRSAFAGIRVSVCVLILNAVIKLLKHAVKDVYTLILYLLVFSGSAILDISPVLFVLFSAFAGILVQVIKERRKV
jgi:chromate transporter